MCGLAAAFKALLVGVSAHKIMGEFSSAMVSVVHVQSCRYAQQVRAAEHGSVEGVVCHACSNMHVCEHLRYVWLAVRRCSLVLRS